MGLRNRAGLMMFVIISFALINGIAIPWERVFAMICWFVSIAMFLWPEDLYAEGGE